MNWFQLKMKVKGAKPPIWRRGFVPEGITFTQLAWILEEMLDCEKTEDYEFDFYRKVIICEWKEGENFRKNFFYSYQSASDTFVNELMSSEKWFTFRVQKDAGQAAEYRIEIEKKASEVLENQKGGKVPISSPIISKEVGFEKCWSDAVEKNAVLKEKYQVHSGKEDYRNFRELQEDSESGKYGLQICENPKNRTGRNQLSMPDLINQFMDSTEIQREELLNSLLGGSPAKERKHIKKDQESREPSVKDMLSTYEKNDLTDMAKELHLRYSRLKKEDLAEKIANEILTPSVMRKRLLILEDYEIAAFEAAMKRKCFFPTDQEWEDLDTVIGLDYIAYFGDECLEVPGEVIGAYQTMNTPEFRQERKRINWMMECLETFGFLYAVAPAETVWKIYGQREGFAVSYEEFLKIFQRIPEDMNPCTLVGEKLTLTILLEKRLYRKIEKIQRRVDYYIPSVDEVHDYYQNRYWTGEPVYRKLKNFFGRELKYDMEEAENLCAFIYQELAKGKMLSDVVGVLTRDGMEFISNRQAEKFMSLMADANNHTRMYELRGHMPAELSEQRPVFAEYDTKIVPMRDVSGSPAEPEKKKVYPNDPCPCGSGKKYKKCCGKKG